MTEHLKTIFQSICLDVELDNGKRYQNDVFEERENELHFLIDDLIQGDLNFCKGENSINVGINLRIKNETSYIHSRVRELKLRVQVNRDSNFLAHYNYNGWWTRPGIVSKEEDIPEQTQFLSWKRDEETYVLMALCDDVFKGIICGDNGDICIRISANTEGYSNISTKFLSLTNNKDSYVAYKNATNQALETLDTTKCNVSKRRYPEVFEYLGYCTWNAFYADVNKEGVLQKADEFKQKNIPVKWFLIDHGWSLQKDEKLTGFQEDKVKFPGGLKSLKYELQEKGVEQLGVWQGFAGHWGTIDKESDLYCEMKDSLMETNTGHIIPYPSKEKSFHFWNKWHRYLRQEGVDFVKVDIQSSLSVFTKGVMPIGKAARESHLGLEASVGVNFDGAMINCMGMATEQYLNRPVSGVSRNSNDFFPHKEKSFKAHVYENAYNSLYHSNLFYGDWDMWWTNHPDATNNAYLRALSGGPLYISDKVEDTIADQLTPLILRDGYVLRCEGQGMIVKDQMFCDPSKSNKAVKLWNRKGNTGYIGGFNCNLEENTVDMEVCAKDIDSLEKAQSYLVVNCADQNCMVVGAEENLTYHLKDKESVLLSYTPILDGFAFLGNRDKYIASAVIQEEQTTEQSKFYVLKQSGIITFYSKESAVLKVNGAEVSPEINDGIYTYDCSELMGKVFVEIIV